jgi:hypothetical protein
MVWEKKERKKQKGKYRPPDIIRNYVTKLCRFLLYLGFRLIDAKAKEARGN